MKIKNILAIAVVAALAPVAMADTTINITGATAFRAAALNSIKNSYTSMTYAYNGGTFTSSTYAIFKGTYPGISGVTTIRTSFSGSVEGVRDVAGQLNVPFLPASTTTSGGGTANAPTGSLDSAKPQLAFSDAFASSTPYDNGTLVGANAGIIGFRFVANQGATLTNITAQQFRALAANGVQPLSLFTGNAADTKTVYLTGRNDGSGTRVTTLAETGFGYANVMNQWKGVTSGTEPSVTVTSLQIWPTGDGANVSNIYNNDTAANGGYSSGGSIATLLGGTSSSVTTKDATGATIATGQDLVILSYLGTNDSYVAAVTNGAVPLSYNGSTLNVGSGGITNPEVIRNGSYTFWGYEHLFWVDGSRTGDLDTFVTALLGTNGLDNATNLGNAGLQTSTMNVSRGDDGGLVGP